MRLTLDGDGFGRERMEEATWDDNIKTPSVDWRMSAALENLPRGEDELAEVTNLEGVVRDWLTLDATHRGEAVLTPERPIFIDGASHDTFTGESNAVLADMLPEASANED